jgi:tetratricopeptide (TPR) repeat protein
MPFGIKPYKPKGGKENEWVLIDYDKVHKEIINPAIEDAGMEPIRADEEKVRGSIHKPMFERIILSDYVVADLTGANANVFYELGIRHAVKPYTTISIFADNCDIPFDLAAFRTMPYKFSPEKGLSNAGDVKKWITEALIDSKTNKTTDSPVYQLVDGIQFQNSVAHQKTDIFRDMVIYDEKLKEELRIVRNTKGDKTVKLAALEQLVNDKFMPLVDQEAAILIDIMLSYRDISAFKKMVEFIEKLPSHVQQTVMVQEQYGFALNRTQADGNQNREKAIRVLKKVIKDNGPSSETYGILGRAYKDYITEYYEQGDLTMAVSYIDETLDAYKRGFEADWRDAYPGINYVTCLDLKGDRDAIKTIMPVVEYSVLRKKEQKEPDYWDEATLAELAVIGNDYVKVNRFLTEAKKKQPVEWMLQTTNKNFMMIRDFRKLRNEDTAQLDALIAILPKP